MKLELQSLHSPPSEAAQGTTRCWKEQQKENGTWLLLQLSQNCQSNTSITANVKKKKTHKCKNRKNICQYQVKQEMGYCRKQVRPTSPCCEAQPALTTTGLKYYCIAVQKKQGEHTAMAIQAVLLQQLQTRIESKQESSRDVQSKFRYVK